MTVAFSPKKVSEGLGTECTHRDPQTGTGRQKYLMSLCMTSLLETNDQLYCWFDFFDSILLYLNGSNWWNLIKLGLISTLESQTKPYLCSHFWALAVGQ